MDYQQEHPLDINLVYHPDCNVNVERNVKELFNTKQWQRQIAWAS